MRQEKKYISEIIIVEGRYDKSSVLNAVDATVLETSGFGIFSNKTRLALFRKLAQVRGIIILTDSDRAGFFIRNRLSGMFNEDLNIKHAYIPEIKGRERRKVSDSKDGKLGVEAMSADIIINALKNAGATFSDTQAVISEDVKITMNDLFTVGISGGSMSAQKRRDLLQRLDLPVGLSSKKLLSVLNVLYSRDDFLDLF